MTKEEVLEQLRSANIGLHYSDVIIGGMNNRAIKKCERAKDNFENPSAFDTIMRRGTNKLVKNNKKMSYIINQLMYLIEHEGIS